MHTRQAKKPPHIFFFCDLCAMKEVYIHGFSCVSPLGTSSAEAAALYASPRSLSVVRNAQAVFPLSASAESGLQAFLEEQSWLRKHSRTVQLAVFAASLLGTLPQRKTLVNIGSSRGSTDLWEQFHRASLQGERLNPAASPSTTPGNIASSVARYLAAESVVLDHSITCGSGLQAIANACAWIRAGMCTQALAGGTEAPLSDFTLAQFRSLGIVSRHTEGFACKPLYKNKESNTLCLGEAAGMALLSPEPSAYRLAGIGFGTEQAGSLSGITPEGKALKGSMREALEQAGIKRPDAVIAHAPGTLRGDAAETAALHVLFGDKIPVYSTKYLTGHTLGASGMLSLQLALLLLDGEVVPRIPYETGSGPLAVVPQTILINATGFGGNAVSLVIKKEEITS